MGVNELTSLGLPESFIPQPHMTLPEADCFRRYLSKAETVVEFGCGGSTYLAVLSEAKKIFSVESDPKWVEKIKQNAAIKQALEAGRLQLYYCDVGEVTKWGKPTQSETRGKWHRYHSGIWHNVDSSVVDLVLVDGRFRVACALQAALRVRSDCKILIHDFWNRPKYHVLLDCFTVLERVDTLGVFQIAQPQETTKLLNLLFKYINEPI